jgi:hypothetical protein
MLDVGLSVTAAGLWHVGHLQVLKVMLAYMALERGVVHAS